MRFETFGSVGAVVLAAGLFFGQPEQSEAALSYSTTQSFVTVSHVTDTVAPATPPAATTNYKLAAPKTNPRTYTPTSTIRTPPAYDFATKQTIGTSNSQGTASVAHITNATTAGVKLGAGTGVSQVNKGAYDGASTLRIDIDQMLWTNNNVQFGPPASGIANFVVGGTVGATAGSFARFTAHLEFDDPAFDEVITLQEEEFGITAVRQFGEYRSAIDFDRTWSTPGTFSETFPSTELFGDPGFEGPNGVILPFRQLRITGFIEFTAFNASTQVPSSFTAQLALPPLDEDELEGTVINFTRDSGVAATTDDELNLEAVVPEPATAGLAGMSLLALAGGALRRRR